MTRQPIMNIGVLSLTSVFGQEAVKPQTKVLRDSEAGVVVEFKLDDFSRQRVLHDSDEDGWCDLWCAVFPELEHRNKAIDTDGDGLTDYQEMVLMRDPMVEGPMPRNLTAAEIAAAKKKAEIRHVESVRQWENRVQEAKNAGMREIIKPETKENDPRLAKREKMLQSLQKKAGQARLQAGVKRNALEKKAAEMGLSLEEKQLDGTVLRFVGESGGNPIFTGSHNRLAAASISADELWPAASAPWASGSTGLDLTGNGQTLAIWENDGGVRTSHNSFGGRVNQRDNASLDTSGHATEVTGTMAASGTGNATATGVAYEADVEAFDNDNFELETLTAASGGYGQVLVCGNNSWGFVNGWRLFIAGFSGGQPIYRWWWDGGPNQGDTIDPKFGRYTEDVAESDFDCVDLDDFVSIDAPHHLPVFSCGNDRGQGPGDAFLRVPPNNLATPTFFVRVGGVTQTRNPNFFPRDWEDGDAGGYDSLAAPGTAKNVLTVGACLDVTYLDGGITVPGFGSGSVVTPAEFSGAGPTDDGRIKPDLVAVGAPSAAARTALGVPVTDGLVTPTQDSNSAFQDEFSTGTSYSAPAVSGGIGLMLQRRSQLYPSLPSNDLWLASTIKALAINGCDDPGNPGPDYRLGHGLFNPATSVAMIDEDYDLGRGSQIKEFELQPNESVSWLVTVESSNPLALTAAWSDPAGPGQPYGGAPDIATPALVNDIDVEIENLETGQILRPWILNPDLAGENVALRETAATRGVDSVNNVERISEEFPVAGVYRITVTHSGGIAGNPAPTAQEISFVSTNATPLMATIDEIEVSPNQNEFIITYASDPGAYYDVETSTDLQNWTTSGSTLAEEEVNTLLVTTQSGDPKRFWRLRRSQ